MKRGRPKKQFSYLRVAARNFLEGTHCRTPEEAVRRGVRTLEAWADALRDAKEAQFEATYGSAATDTERSRFA